MDATTFEFQLSVPRDAQVAAIVRMIAKYAGCTEPGAAAFGEKVAEAVRAHVNGSPGHGAIPVVVRRSTGPLEVQVDTHTVALEL